MYYEYNDYTVTIPDNIPSDMYYVSVPSNVDVAYAYAYNRECFDYARTVVFHKVPVYHRILNGSTYLTVKSFKWVPDIEYEEYRYHEEHNRDLINEIDALRSFISSGIINGPQMVPLHPLRDYEVVCDERNNTTVRIDRNDLCADIHINKPNNDFDDLDELFTL